MSAGKRKISVGSSTPAVVVSNGCVSSTDQDSTEKRIRRKMEEKDILGSTSTTVNGGATDQDSTEKRIRREIEEEDVSTSDTSDSSDSEEEIDEDICTEIVPEKKQTVSPFYIKSCSQTQIKTNSILDHTWKINQFMWLYNTVKTMTYISPPFPETGQYRIQMKVLPSYYSGTLYNIVCFYILTSNTFNALCTTTISLSSGKVLSSKSTSGPISNNTLLIEIRYKDFKELLLDTDTLIIHCKFEFFCNLINKTIRLNSLPSSNKVSEDVTYFEDLTFDEFCSKNKTASEKKSVNRK